MALTDAKLRALKPADKPFKSADGGGLYIEVSPAGGKLWRLKYRVDGKEKRIALGKYPEVGLAEARDAAIQAKKQLAQGIDPSQEKKLTKAARAVSGGNTFEVIAREWFAKFSPQWAAAHADRVWRRIERDLLPWLGSRPINSITSPELLVALRRIEDRGAVETAHRARSDFSVIARYAIATGRAERDCAADLRGAIPPAQKKHFAAQTDPAGLAHILKLIQNYPGGHTVRTALRLAPMLFARPGELRQMRWAHLDLAAGVWKLPAVEMKKNRDHIVPLSRQAKKLIDDMPRQGEYVFPSQRGQGRPMSNMAMNAALKSLGVNTQIEQTSHGFRASARTILHEVMGFPPEVIEAQLSHKNAGALGEAYNRTKFLPERKKMMQSWSDYLETLINGKEK